MKLPRDGREYYGGSYILDPPYTGAWEVDFGNGYVAADSSDDGVHLWLVSGPDFVPEAGDDTASVTITRDVTPKWRAVDNPEVVIRTPGPIRLRTSID
jgi:hypothetical protein